ncbi:MAG: marine proteobacterial sortase target protein [Deltaproteobacteria bacterium]|nr:marine proteobacterial sortase target protein [Deltaproteobacteria bacterium]
MNFKKIFRTLLSSLPLGAVLLSASVTALASDLHSEITQGVMRALGQEGKPVADLPLKHTKVSAKIAGFISEVTVTQTFQNPSKDPIEAIYVFPLPQNAAVGEMFMKIGDRTIHGQIKLREEARKIYEEAKNQGKIASLLDQERPNIFTQSVANIMPGHEIEVTLKYVEVLVYEKGSYEFMFPMVVGPRFIPGEPVSKSSRGWADDTDLVPDASRITPPYLKPKTRSGHDIEVSVAIDAGVPLQDVSSETHQIKVDSKQGSKAVVTLRPFDSIPNKDFVLRYGVAGDSVETGFLTHREKGKDGFFTLIVPPVKEIPDTQVTPKEMVFVVDTSGSMSGEPIAKAKEAMRYALRHMNQNDTFKIILFNSDVKELSTKPLLNSSDNVQKGLAFIDQIQAGGGTLMMEGVNAALGFGRDPSRLRIVLFMTDGYIGNESQIFAAIQDQRNDARVFSFGVGSSVNRYLLEEMARVGRGAVTYVTLNEETKGAVAKFYERISKPFLTGLSIETVGANGRSPLLKDIYPEKIPDLFSAQPVVVHGRFSGDGAGTITLKGKLGGKPWQKEVPVALPDEQNENSSIASVWARTRIADLSRENYGGEKSNVVQKITNLALEYHLMSQYTSFVAVEEKIVNENGKVTTVQVPIEMPQGVSYQGVFGEKDDGDTGGYGVLNNVAPAPMEAKSKKYVRQEAGVDKERATSSQTSVPPNGDKERATSSQTSVPPNGVKTDSFSYQAGSPVTLQITFTNTAGKELEVELSPRGVELEVIGPVGLRLQANGQKGTLAKIGAGETKTFEIDLAKFFNLKTPGIYVVKVKKVGSIVVTVKAVTFRVE